MTLDEEIKQRLFAVRQIEHENGDVTWIPVDLDIFTDEDQFQVFNTFTGQHEYFDNITSAKNRWDELKQEITLIFNQSVEVNVQKFTQRI